MVRGRWARKREVEFDELECSDYFPRQHSKRYDGKFLKLFSICVQQVAWKIVSPETATLACTAEELAFRAVMIRARASRDYRHDTNPRKKKRRKSDEDLERYEEAAVWDGDVELIFDPSMDGIEEAGPAGHDLANLTFKDWFKPFRPDNPVHPFVGEYGG